MASLPSQPHSEAPAGTALGRSLQKLVSRVEAAVERLPIELVLGVYAALIIARFPLLVYDPRLWAEEGFVYFMHAVREPWLTALLSEHVSYYALWPNLSGVLATLVPLEYAPFPGLVLSFAAQLFPALVLAYGSSTLLPSKLHRAVAMATLLFTVPSGEVWLNSINSQFFFAVTTAIVLVVDTKDDRTFRWCTPLLLVAGLTGVVSAALAPVYALVAVWERSRRRAIQAAILGSCVVLQGLVVLTSEHEGRDFRFAPHLMLAFVFKHLALLFTGQLPLRRILSPVLAGGHTVLAGVAFGIVAIALLSLLAKAANREGRALLACAAVLVGLAYLGAKGSESSILLHNNRYSFAPNVLLALCLLSVSSSGARVLTRLAPALALGLALSVGLVQNSVQRALGTDVKGPSWRQEVAGYRRDASDPLVIWPAPSIIRLGAPVDERGLLPTQTESRLYGIQQPPQ
jgi:hypothetical protein